MFEVINNNMIKITKGDTATLNVSIVKDGSEYSMVSGDTLTFTARKRIDTPILVQVTSSNNVIDLSKTDTSKLEIGECVFDIVLDSNNKQYTIIGLKRNESANMYVVSGVK